MSERATVEIFTFAGCPSLHAARELVERVIVEEHNEVSVGAVEVRDAHDAEQLRLLGSPTIPCRRPRHRAEADERTEYVFACRIYRTPLGRGGSPTKGGSVTRSRAHGESLVTVAGSKRV